MKKYINRILCLGLAIGVFTACELDEPEIEYTAASQLSGEWYIQYEYEENGEWVNPDWGYYTLLTSNTAANLETEMFVNDIDGWGISYKVDVNDLTFSVTGSTEVGGTGDVTVTNGIVIKDGGLSTSGVVSDSISFEFIQPTDDATLYRASGIRRTGFLEDEH